MKKPVKPDREPDIIVDSNRFWFEEKIQVGIFGGVYHFNFEDFTFSNGATDRWCDINPRWKKDYGDTVKDAYAGWALEKEIGL